MKFPSLLGFVLTLSGMTTQLTAVQFSLAETVVSRGTASSTSKRISRLTREVARIETLCLPRRGTSREQVERLFGAGKATFKSKTPPAKPVSEHSPYRSYILCPNGRLFVNYDKQWNVLWATYIDPYSTKGLAAGAKLSPEKTLHELESRRAQMEQILAACERLGQAKPS